MNKEELQKKHLEAIENCAKVLWGQHFTYVPQAATACTTITLQTVVEVLGGMESELSSWGEYQAANYVETKITECTNLLNQNK